MKKFFNSVYTIISNFFSNLFKKKPKSENDHDDYKLLIWHIKFFSKAKKPSRGATEEENKKNLSYAVDDVRQLVRHMYYADDIRAKKQYKKEIMKYKKWYPNIIDAVYLSAHDFEKNKTYANFKTLGLAQFMTIEVKEISKNDEILSQIEFGKKLMEEMHPHRSRHNAVEAALETPAKTLNFTQPVEVKAKEAEIEAVVEKKLEPKPAM